MTTIDVNVNDKLLCIEICEVWDFVRDIHSYQANVVNKASMQRYIVGEYKSYKIAEEKAREWINKL